MERFGRTRARSGAIVAAVALVAAAGAGAIGAPRAAHATSLPELNVADLSAQEGDFGNATLHVPVSLSEPSAVTVKVPYVVAASPDGSADPADARLYRGTLSFAAGVITKPVSVVTYGDTSTEPNQHVTITLGTPVNGTATVGKGTGTVTLVDDDADGVPASTMQVSIGDVTIVEGDEGWQKAYFPVLLSSSALEITKVQFSIDCSTASLIDDVKIANRGVVTFQIGQREKDIAFSISADLSPDEVKDLVQSISMKLGTARVLDNRGDATIDDNDGSLPSHPGYAVPGFTESPLPSGASSFNAQAVGGTEMLDVNAQGVEGHFNYTEPTDNQTWVDSHVASQAAFNADGRYAVFTSEQTDLVPNDTNGLPDLFVRDRATGVNERVNLHDGGGQVQLSDFPTGSVGFALYPAAYPVVSADGRYIAYMTGAALDPSDSRAIGDWTVYEDIYLYDRQAHTTELVSADASGNAMGGGWYPSISADGRYVMFGGGPSHPEVYVRDRVNHTTTKIYDTAGAPPVLSANGRIALVPSPGIGCREWELDAIDLVDGSIERIDVTDDGLGAAPEGAGGTWMYEPAISGDGRYVAFRSSSWNLVPGMNGPEFYAGTYDSSLVHVYLRDRQAATTRMLGLGADGTVPPPAPTGSSLAMDGNATRVSLGNAQGLGTVYDLVHGTQATFGPPDIGTQFAQTGTAVQPNYLSYDGRYVSFESGHVPSGLNRVVFYDSFAQRIG